MAITSSVRRLGAATRRALVDLYGSLRLTSERRRARGAEPQPGITVVTANWNTLHFVQSLIEQVQERSSADCRIVVVDNASSDGSRSFLEGRSDIDAVLLRANVRHGRAIDIGITHARTEVVVVLDVDAFPISDDWLDGSLEALRQGCKLSGAYFHRNYIHPCFLVMHRATLVDNRLSFRPVGKNSAAGSGPFGLFLDAGEALSQATIVKFGQKSVHQIPFTEVQGPGMGGSVFGNVVYHNFYATSGDQARIAIERYDEAIARFTKPGSGVLQGDTTER